MSASPDIDMPEATTLGALIRHARERAGMRQTDLAAAVHVGMSAVSGWERGAQSPTATVLPALAEALGVEFVAGRDGQWQALDAAPDRPPAPQVVVLVAGTAEAMREALDRLGIPRGE